MAKNKQLEPIVRAAYSLFHVDALHGVPHRVKNKSVKLIVIDPPYNIGQDYSDYIDKLPKAEFLLWLQQRIQVGYNALSDDGSMWIAINDANVAEVKLMCEQMGLYLRKWVIWFYTFGQANSRNFASSHTHWLYFSKHRTKYTFNHNDPAVRVPSARQTVYNDKRANVKGKLPDDCWILRPQELDAVFTEGDGLDFWYFSRICGTFKAKVKADEPIPNQMPEAMLDRIIRISSNVGDTVMDHFNGTGTTGASAVRLGRKYIGFDVSRTCILETDKRLAKVATAAAKRVAQGSDQPELTLFDTDPKKPKKAKR